MGYYERKRKLKRERRARGETGMPATILSASSTRPAVAPECICSRPESLPKFETRHAALDYVRELGRPVVVVFDGAIWDMFPKGRDGKPFGQLVRRIKNDND